MNTPTVKPVSIKQVQLAVKKHIIDGMDLAAYDIAPKFDNVNYEGDIIADAQTVIACCESEFIHKGNRHLYNVTPANVVSEWLAGLPSVLNIAFANYDIIQIGLSCGAIKSEYPTAAGRDTAENNFIDSWFNRAAIQLLKITKMKHNTKAYNDLIVYCKETNLKENTK